MLDNDSRIHVQLHMKVNLGNYESAEANVMLSGLRPDTTPEDVDHLLDVGKIAYDKMKVKLASQVNEIKQARNRGGKPA